MAASEPLMDTLPGQIEPELPSEEHRMLQDLTRDFTAGEVEPQAGNHDREGSLNVALMRRAGELGLLGMTIPSEDGGGGLDATAAVIVHHELSKSDPGFTLALLAHAILFVNNFYHSANADQRARFLPGVLSAKQIGAMGMTEPSAGTDVLGMKTTAERRGDDYVLQGRKTFITNAPDADYFLVYAKVQDRITAFVVEKDRPGFSVGPSIDKMGMRGSPMAELIFEECAVPADNLLGAEGGGMTHMMRNLEIERICLAAMSVGIADRCLAIMARYSVDREAFGKPIAEFGQIQRYVADSYAKAEAARTLVYRVARDVGEGKRNRIGTDAAKLFAAPVGKEIADNAMQVLGGWGYCTEFTVERLLRDAKLLEIGGGTLESHQKNLTRDLTRSLADR
ncbi:MAG: acyl-CoA dehydrogenase family protein [Candidatus Binatia bacterium]|nr:acyl-CoA dehydrogenase family protein [Candidatus Binatia bacterium]